MTGGPAGRLGLIGGSGLYRMAALADGVWTAFDTPWGEPSDDLLLGTIAGREVAFLPRHGRGHRIAARRDQRPRQHRRAEGGRLHRDPRGLGGRLATATAAAGTFVIVDQFVDRTVRGGRSFFGEGIVGHVAFGRPTCAAAR